MHAARRPGRIIGLLLLVLIASGLTTPYIMLRPLTTIPAGFLQSAAGMAAVVRLDVLLLFVGGVIPLWISITAWPAVRGRHPSQGLLLMAVATANFVLQLVENAHWLTMLSMSEAFAKAGPAGAAPFHTLGLAVRAAWKWAHYSHIFVVVGWLFLFFLLLFRSGGAPRPLAGFAMGVCVLHFVGITLPVFAGYRMPYPMLFGMPVAFGILGVAAWLLARGFGAPPGGLAGAASER